jgi:hypothetical protein
VIVGARAAIALAVAAAACGKPDLTSCADDLGGPWTVVGATTPSGEPRRYHALDLGTTVELYPMFDDGLVDAADRKTTAPAAVIAAPAAFDLARSRGLDELSGHQERRFMRGGQSCTLRALAHLRGCAGDHAILETTELAPPTDWARCAQAPAPSVQWQLSRGP